MEYLLLNLITLIMMKNNKPNQTLCLEDIVKERPILTESEMNNFYTYEEAVAECIRLFKDGVNTHLQDYDNDTNTTK